jgi:hypothetical protein
MMMAERHGGMRRPNNPAPVSGPGQLSQRTDGGPQQVQADMMGGDYGDNQAMEAIQGMAPMSASPSAASPRARQRQARQTGQAAGGMGAGLFSPTQRPDEPVTAGAPFGPGEMDRDETMFQESLGQDFEALKKYLPDLEEAANFTNAPGSFRYLVSYLRNM